MQTLRNLDKTDIRRSSKTT